MSMLERGIVLASFPCGAAVVSPFIGKISGAFELRWTIIVGLVSLPIWCVFSLLKLSVIDDYLFLTTFYALSCTL